MAMDERGRELESDVVNEQDDVGISESQLVQALWAKIQQKDEYIQRQESDIRQKDEHIRRQEAEIQRLSSLIGLINLKGYTT